MTTHQNYLGSLSVNIQIPGPHPRCDKSEYPGIASTGLLFFFFLSPDDPTVQPLVDTTVLESGVEIVTSGIKIQINNAKYIYLQRAKT